MVDSLQEKVKAEQEARMQRALENLERAARVESERAKQSFEIQQEAELTLSKKFKSIVSDLRRSWEEEETGRAMQLEERLRSHYSVVLEHMEAQLKMALKLQDDADKQWLEDVEARNTQQIETLRAFEDKCKRLYDIRLTEYAEKTSQQIAQYEEQLLEVKQQHLCAVPAYGHSHSFFGRLIACLCLFDWVNLCSLLLLLLLLLLLAAGRHGARL